MTVTVQSSSFILPVTELLLAKKKFNSLATKVTEPVECYSKLHCSALFDIDTVAVYGKAEKMSGVR